MLMRDHNVQFIAGDFNARHPSWCRRHDDKKRGTLLREIVRDAPRYRIAAPSNPTFQAKYNRHRGDYGSSTIDLVVAKARVSDVRRLEGKLSEGSDHYPVLFRADIEIDKEDTKRRIPKTLLQSKHMREVAATTYGVTLKEAGTQYEETNFEEDAVRSGQGMQGLYTHAQDQIKAPWEAQVNRRRRKSGANVNGELLRLWERKKQMYERWRWMPSTHNKAQYKDACRRAQRRERQLLKEQERRAQQRIQIDPENEIAKALPNGAQRRHLQKQIDRASGKQLRPKQFALYLGAKLDGPTGGIQPRPFTIDCTAFRKDVMRAIRTMECNKAIGEDGLHVEMLKSHPEAAATLFTKMWSAVGRSCKIPEDWLKGIIVPLYKGKGCQKEPVNFRPLCILSHVRKLVEKAEVSDLDRKFQADRAQYGFQAGVQVTQAALSVLAAIHGKRANFIVVLDLSKAYDTIHKQLMLSKLDGTVDRNLASQLAIFLHTVTGRVTGDITDTPIAMLRVLTQGGTSSPALFKLFIDTLPEEVRAALRESNEEAQGLDPLRLVADDVVGLSETVAGLQILLDTCYRWATRNSLSWNPTKSQVLQLNPTPNGEEPKVDIDGVQLTVSPVVDYLGLRLTRNGFIGKEITELTSKGTASLHMLMAEKWFSLELPPKHIARAFQMYVRGVLTYGAELLSSTDRHKLEKVDDKLLSVLLTRLLGLGRERGRLAEKHRWRLQIALGIPTLQMDLEMLLAGRVDAWLERRTSPNPKVGYHAGESLQNITCLHEDHPLGIELNKRTPTLKTTREARKARGWEDLLEASKGSGGRSGQRQLVSSGTGLNQDGREKGDSIVDDRDVAADLKKEALRWTIYRFPVPYAPTEEENFHLNQMPRWASLGEEARKNTRDVLFKVFNAEQQLWKMKPLEHAGARDVRSATRRTNDTLE